MTCQLWAVEKSNLDITIQLYVCQKQNHNCADWICSFGNQIYKLMTVCNSDHKLIDISWYPKYGLLESKCRHYHSALIVANQTMIVWYWVCVVGIQIATSTSLHWYLTVYRLSQSDLWLYHTKYLLSWTEYRHFNSPLVGNETVLSER